MPELPDITIYIEALEGRVIGRAIERTTVISHFFVRSFDPPLDSILGKRVGGLRRLGKRIVFELEDDLFVVIHLMIAGRLRWLARANAKIPRKLSLMAFHFDEGTLLVTEAGTKKRASLHVVRGEEDLALHARGGVEVMEASVDDFASALRRENHTLKRSLTDPRLFSGIGNAYSDEILLEARMSPLRMTSKLTDDEIEHLREITQKTLREAAEQLREKFGARFPGAGDITAFRPEFGAHGKYGEPCPHCGTKIQRIRYAEHETNYCPRCQTGGKLLADRSLSRLLKSDWPRTIEELENGGK